MNDGLSIVMDTNALLSAILYPNSIPHQALVQALNRGILLFSPATADEFEEITTSKIRLLFKPNSAHSYGYIYSQCRRNHYPNSCRE